MNQPDTDELLKAWQAAKQAADDYEANYNRLNALHRGDPDAEFRSEGAFYEIDRLREIEREAHARYLTALPERPKT